MRVLVAGWFSYAGMTTTAGDLLARDVTDEWLTLGAIPHDVATAPVLGGTIDILKVDPADYTHLLFVCGPFRQNALVEDLQRRFSHCRWIGLNLSMLMPLETWNPFDVLFERDSSRTERPDITLASHQASVPVVGFILVHPQPQYGDRARHDQAHQALEAFWSRHECTRVDIDTCIEGNAHRLRTPAEIESAISKMDVVITTRLHGTVLALKNGVPVVAVDPIAGGAKILQQARALGWPAAFDVDSATAERLDDAFRFCLSAEGRERARQCVADARAELEHLRTELVNAIRDDQTASRAAAPAG